MELLTFFIGLFLLIISAILVLKNKGLDIISLFSLIWATVFCMASLRLYGMISYSLKTVLIIFIGASFFILFGIFFRYFSLPKLNIIRKKSNSKRKKIRRINRHIVNFILVIVTVFMIYSFIRMLNLYFDGIPFGTIHAMYLNRGGEPFYTISILNQIHSKIVIPCIYCLIPIIVYYFLLDRKTYKWIIIVGFIDIFLYTVSTGSRTIIILLFTDAVLAIPLAKKYLNEEYYKWIKKSMILFIIITVIGILGYTAIRKGFAFENVGNIFTKIFEEGYKYISLCIPFSDQWIHTIDSIELFTNGKMTFFSVLSLIEWIFVQFFRFETFSFLDVCKDVSSQLEIMIPIFKNAECNAFVTFIFYFYSDFRLFGVVLFSSLWGCFSGLICQRVYKEPQEYSIMFYLLLIQSVVLSFSRWAFYDAPYFLAFIIMLLIFTDFSVLQKKVCQIVKIKKTS